MAKERRFKTYSHRWGEGKVHRYLYDSVNKMWYVACRGIHRSTPHGRETIVSAPVTCKKCL